MGITAMKGRLKSRRVTVGNVLDKDSGEGGRHHIHVKAALAQAHPSSFDWKSKRNSSRPEDVHIHFGSHAQKGVKRWTQKLHDHAHQKRPLQGIGPQGAAPDLTDDAFEPASYYL